MTICIIATICKETGALSIYNQMMSHLVINKKKSDSFFVFLDPIMPQPEIKGVTYIKYNTSGKNRLKFDLIDFGRICKDNDIKPDVIFSLNNSGVNSPNVRQIIYYHQALPLYNYHFSIQNKKDRIKRLFTKFYPYYVKCSLKKHTSVIVQTKIVRKLFAKRYHFPIERIHVAFPDVEHLHTNNINKYVFEENTHNFVYPAIVSCYKEHVTIAKALQTICDDSIRKRIRIHLTIKDDEREDLKKIITSSGLQQNFVFHGLIPHEQLLSMYKSADGLVFPSVIETIGLPLLEAAAFGLPVLANDLDYVKDVLEGYDGLKTVPLRDYQAWGDAIVGLCQEKLHYAQYQRCGESDWSKVFHLIHEGI